MGKSKTSPRRQGVNEFHDIQNVGFVFWFIPEYVQTLGKDIIERYSNSDSENEQIEREGDFFDTDDEEEIIVPSIEEKAPNIFIRSGSWQQIIRGPIIGRPPYSFKQVFGP